ncbi:phage major capsid protein [Nocardia neocaledoniensis]|uniref:phage major capsid protein n=1 Tax=Nocardia neocaledoniensis TaxID=236511 RepID=UPI002455CBC3|nr:phage major capsid protein [Nocardia neocaledoniensis]
MNLKQQLAAAKQRAGELAKVGGEREFTDDELAEIDTLKSTITDLETKIARMDAAAAALKSVTDDTDPGDDDQDDEPGAASAKSGGARTRPRDEAGLVKSFGHTFVKSDQYKEFRKQYPSGVGNGSPVDIGRVKVGSMEDWYANRGAKATLTTAIGRVQPIRMPTIDLVERNRLTLLDLIDRGQTDGNFEYVQITGVTQNAAVVPESTGPADSAALKPTSDMTTTLADAKVVTYADGYDVTNQMLSDAPAMATYMNAQLDYSLSNVVEEKLLNGTGTSGEPRGILATSGVQQQTYVNAGGTVDDTTAMAFVKAIRKGITKVVRLDGGKVDAIVISPEMDEAIDLLQDANERFYGQGPFGSGPNTLWGRPRVTSERLTDTHGLLGDFKQVALLDREGLSVLAFNQHKDYAQRNMTYVRAELRAAQVIWKPNRLVVVKPAV